MQKKEVQEFSDKQIEKQLQKQVKFLKTIYPFLEEDSWNEGAIELRPIKRDKDLKGYIRSYNAWHMQEKDKEALKKFLKMINGKGYCLYYSTFTFDNSLEVLKADGKPMEKGKINKQNSLFTSILAMDLDNITEKEYKEHKEKLTKVGIETIDVATGHGYQLIILLEHKVYDKDILAKFTKLLISKGFKADESIIDCARVLRMPYSFNCKALDKKSKYFGTEEVLPVKLISATDKRYHVADVFKQIQALEDVIPMKNTLTSIDLTQIKIEPFRANTEVAKKEIKEVKNINIQSLRHKYYMLNWDRLEEPIQKMLAGAQEGLRNQVMIFLIPFLRNSLGLNIQTIKQVMTIWGSKCSPKLDQDFVLTEVDRMYSYGLKAKVGKYTADLTKAYGYLELGIYKRDNKVLLPNEFFEDFDVMTDGSVRIYLAMKLANSRDGVLEFTKEDIAHYADIAIRTVERNTKDLIKMGYVCKRKDGVATKKGEKYIYYINPYFNATTGFTMLEKAVVVLMIKNLTDGEMKLYTYLCRMISVDGTNCWASQKYLAKKIGKAGHNSISFMTDSLQDKKFITKNTYTKNGIMHSVYNLEY